MMKTSTIVLISALLFAAQALAEIKTPGIDPPFKGSDGDTVLADINNPTVGDGSTPNGISADQVFSEQATDSSLLTPVTAGVDNNEPVLSTGRKMLGGRKMLDELSLTGNGVQAGYDGVGVTEQLSGHGIVNAADGDVTDEHIQPHAGETTVTAGGKSVSTGAGVDPDNLGGENGDAVVYTTPGRK